MSDTMKMKIDTNRKIKMHKRGESDGRSLIRGISFCWVLRILLHLNDLLSLSSTLVTGRKDQRNGHICTSMVHGMVLYRVLITHGNHEVSNFGILVSLVTRSLNVVRTYTECPIALCTHSSY